ncbi:hypothetical protein [Nocardia sp. NBC_01009]|uniref:hypothetical protein n=1 Tax=Nocardia sp. NBC_01009 TaxID=2975996 RepID=UPI003863AA27|nr:hypothetical protein OHA42_25825 [Nocardia sp. NBC_01009]
MRSLMELPRVGDDVDPAAELLRCLDDERAHLDRVVIVDAIDESAAPVGVPAIGRSGDSRR